MYKKTIFTLSFLALPTIAFSEAKKHSPFKNFLIGAGAGATVPLLLEPLVYFKNCYQQQKPIASNPRIWYRGLFINMTGIAPTLATQNMIFSVVQEHLDGTSFHNNKNSIAALSAGLGSSPITCVRELLIIQQQNCGGNAYRLLSSFISKHGYKKLLSGLTPVTIRNMTHATSLFAATPAIKEALNNQGFNHSAQNLMAPIAAGAASAVITQPFDTIKTQMQARVDGTTMKQAFLHLYNSKNSYQQVRGLRGLYLGLLPRVINTTAAITIASNAKDYISRLLDK